ncbi:MAG: DUF4124 domain-containing protein [Betaproteobacteria bacterium]
MNRENACVRLTLIVALLGPGAAGAQTMFKCLDGKSVTYSNTPCEKLGLKKAGEVADRVTTLPSLAPAAAKAPAAKSAPAGAVPGNEVDLPKTSTTRPVNPPIEKLSK